MTRHDTTRYELPSRSTALLSCFELLWLPRWDVHSVASCSVEAIGESTARPRALLAELLLSSAPLVALRCWLVCCWSAPLVKAAVWLRRAGGGVPAA